MLRKLILLSCSCLLLACTGTNTSSSSSSSSGRIFTDSSSSSSSSSSTSSSSSSSSSSSGSGSSSSSSSSGSAQPRCSETLATQNKATVKAALTELFIDKKPAAINKYWAEPYLQHNPIAKSGVAAFSSIMTSAVSATSFKYEIIGVFGECDLVAVIGKYSQTGVIVDMFRLKDNKIMEHWDSDSNQAATSLLTASAISRTHTTLTGPLNLETITDLFTLGLIPNQSEIIDSFFDPRAYINRTKATGFREFSNYLNSSNIRYKKIHHIIAEPMGDVVFVLSEGTLDGKAYAFYDFFRVYQHAFSDGSVEVYIGEHWDSRRPVPTSTASGLPIF